MPKQNSEAGKALSAMQWQLRPAQGRYDVLEGRQYFVVPSVILLEGVHCPTGAGPACLYYPPEEIAASTEFWDGVPVVVMHPFDADGNPISARTPGVLNAQGVGRLFNTRYDSATTKLYSELWLDMARLGEISPQAAEAIRGGQPLDVSNGMYLVFDMTTGEWHEERFDAVAREYQPDHLALLPGTQGACSWADGCGVRAASKGGAMDKQAIAGALARLRPMQEPSHGDIRKALQQAVDRLDGNGWVHIVVDVFDDRFIYAAATDNPNGGPPLFYQQGYAVNDSETVELVGSPIEVKEERRYVPVASQADGHAVNTDTRGPSMTKAEIIDGLIANASTRFGDTHRDWLGSLTECQLEVLQPVEQPPAAEEPDPVEPPPVVEEPEKAEPTAPEPQPQPQPTSAVAKAVTTEEFIAQAPPEIQAVLRRAVARDNEVKTKLVESLRSHKHCKFSADELKAKDVGELERLASLARIDADFTAGAGADRDISDEIPLPPPLVPVSA